MADDDGVAEKESSTIRENVKQKIGDGDRQCNSRVLFCQWCTS